MLEGLLAQYVMQRLIDHKHPAFDINHCINKKQKKIVCGKCKEICPQNVYELSDQLDWDNCANCNLCVTVCPSRCLLPSAVNLEKYLSALQSKEPSLCFSCAATAPKADLAVPCLAALPWELLCCFALKKDVSILTGACGQCELEGRSALLESNLAKAAQFLGDEYFNKHVSLLHSETVLPEKAYTRRELFSFLSGRSKSAAGVTATLLTKGNDKLDGLFFRKLLYTLIKEQRETPVEGRPLPAEFQWLSPSFSQSCWACENCAKVCPQNAIKFSDAEENKLGIIISPWKCNACGLCKDICSYGGIGGLSVLPVESLRPIEMHSVQVTPCVECGKTIMPGTELCPVCASKAKRRKK